MERSIDLRNVDHVHLAAAELKIDNLSLDLIMRKTDKDAANSTPPTASQPLVASHHAKDGKYHLLLAASGSVATIKIPNIIQGLAKHKALSIRLVLTESAANFLQGQSDEQPSLDAISKYPNVDGIYRDQDEWRVPWVRGNPILHIELRRWADLMVIAPLSANTLAKISNGMCDNLLTSVVRAWQVEPLGPRNGVPTHQKHIFAAPAMNTAMWRHPLTEIHLNAPYLKGFSDWFEILRPVEKELACGDTGDGAMRDWREIVESIQHQIRGQGIVRDQAS